LKSSQLPSERIYWQPVANGYAAFSATLANFRPKSLSAAVQISLK